MVPSTVDLRLKTETDEGQAFDLVTTTTDRGLPDY